MQSPTDEAPENGVWQELSPMLDEAMARLSESDRDALVLRFFQKKSLSELGEALGVEERAAQKRVARGLEKLRAFFAKRGVVLSTMAIAGAVSAGSVQAAPAGLAVKVSAAGLTQGAAAGSSTLTVVKGVLKIMAWTKVKVAIVVGVSVLVAAETTTVVVRKIAERDPAHIYEEIWRQPDSRSMAKLEAAPPIVLVRPTRYPKGGSGYWNTQGKGMFVNASMKDLIAWGESVSETRIVLGEGVPQGGFDYLNTLPADQTRVLDVKLKEQFGLAVHREAVETDVLVLRMVDSARLAAHRAKGGREENSGMGDGKTQSRTLKNQKIDVTAAYLEPLFEKPVVTHGDLTGKYDFIFSWKEQHGKSGDERMEAIREALEEELAEAGLELAPSRESVEVLVVEKN